MGKQTRREFLEYSMLAAATAAVPAFPAVALGAGQKQASANEVIRVGVIGVRGRGRAHVGEFKKSPDTQVVAICDPDEGVIEGAMQAVPDAKYYRDIRKMLEDDSIDAVSIATPNHWHSLAAIWALQAGKHVYVEKPISHHVFEGRKVVEAARKYGKIVQHGTQARSSRATIEAIKWLHEGNLGKISIARGLCYKRRESIGKVSEAQDPPATMDFDLWTGPARLGPIKRSSLHYDWHWVFNTGNGDIGNQGVHQLDIARWGLEKAEWPTRVSSCGGRVGYDDDGNTPNTLMSVYEYGDQRLIFEVRGLKTSDYRTAKIGVIFHGEHGYLVSGSYDKVLAFDHDGNAMRTFEGGGNHFQNFINAVKSGDASILNAESIEGHRSASLCHLGNISYQLGETRTLTDISRAYESDAAGHEAFGRMKEHLAANQLAPEATSILLGAPLAIDPKSEQFTGARADEANLLMTRKARAPFVVPDQV